jgi:hypothetical protein
MYTTLSATRDFALKASGAAARAMQRSVCCKSQFKFKCFSCGEMIHRGDKITMAHGGEGMTLRFRGSDSRCGLAEGETCFYQPSTGSKRWVHIGCNPCLWYNAEGFTPELIGVWTEWAAKIQNEFEDDYALNGRWDMEDFLKRRGYPQEKYQSDRVKAGVTKFQALWRGHFAMAHPWALKQKRTTEAAMGPRNSKIRREFLEWCASLSRDEFRSFPLFCQLSHAATKFQALWRGYLYKQAYPIVLRAAKATEAINFNARATLSTHNHYARIKANSERDDAEAEAMFYCHNKSRVGSNSAILFDRGRTKEAIYSCEIVRISGESNGVQVYVRFHHDQERRKYHWKRFKLLERECHSFMIERGIQLIGFEGKIPTHPRFWNGCD